VIRQREWARLFRGPIVARQNALADATMTSADSGGRLTDGDSRLAKMPQPDRAFSHASVEPKWDMRGRPVRLAQVGGCW